MGCQDRQEKEATLSSPVSRIGGGGVRDEVTKRNLWFYAHAMSPFQAARGAKPHPTDFQGGNNVGVLWAQGDALG